MVQGKINSKRKVKKDAPKRKAAPIKSNEDNNLLNSSIGLELKNQTNKHQKKIYKSIEKTIIEKAKQGRERFEIL